MNIAKDRPYIVGGSIVIIRISQSASSHEMDFMSRSCNMYFDSDLVSKTSKRGNKAGLNSEPTCVCLGGVGFIKCVALSSERLSAEAGRH